MTDRELLELAARAAGIRGEYFASSNPIHNGIYLESQDRYWNPLTDDGDALRLQVGQLISLKLTQTAAIACHRSGVRIRQRFNGDAPSAAKRAVVRAAAEIGKAMP